MSIKSFSSQIKGIRNIVDIALGSELESVPPLVFASSISDLQSKSI